MATPYELAPMIEMVAAHLRPALVCRDNVESMLSIARGVPSWQCAGVECRLGDPAPRADFGIHLRRQHGIPVDAQRPGGAAPPRRPLPVPGSGCVDSRTPGPMATRSWRRPSRPCRSSSTCTTATARHAAAPSIFSSMRFGPRGAARARPRSLDPVRRGRRRGARRAWGSTPAPPARRWTDRSGSCCRGSRSSSSACGWPVPSTPSGSVRRACRFATSRRGARAGLVGTGRCLCVTLADLLEFGDGGRCTWTLAAASRRGSASR